MPIGYRIEPYFAHYFVDMLGETVLTSDDSIKDDLQTINQMRNDIVYCEGLAKPNLIEWDAIPNYLKEVIAIEKMVENEKTMKPSKDSKPEEHAKYQEYSQSVTRYVLGLQTIYRRGV